MMEQQLRPFLRVQRKTLTELFQEIQGQQYSTFHNFSAQQRQQSLELIYKITFMHNNKDKILIKTERDILRFQSELEQNFRTLALGFHLETQDNSQRILLEYLNNIYDGVNNSQAFRKFNGQMRILKQDQTELVFQNLYHGLFTQSRVVTYADVATWPHLGIFQGDPRYLAINNKSLLTLRQQFSGIDQSQVIQNQFSFSFPQLNKHKLRIVLNLPQISIELIARNVESFVILGYFASKIQSNLNLQANKYQGFAPSREGSIIEHFIDGKDYFKRLLDDLKYAKQEVYITGWRISPQFYLQRNPKGQSTLERVLIDLANGEYQVKIYILLFNVPQFVMPSKPGHAINTFAGTNNIQILLHPNYLQLPNRSHPIVYSHHEKLVIIDKKIAFMGGFDIAFGRYDDHKHRLSDTQQEYTWLGADYCNQRIIDNQHPDQPERQIEEVRRASTPRMPWHDIGARLQGRCMKHLQAHFVQYWNHAASTKRKTQKLMFNQSTTQMAKLSFALEENQEKPFINYENLNRAASELFSEEKLFGQQDQKILEDINKQISERLNVQRRQNEKNYSYYKSLNLRVDELEDPDMQQAVVESATEMATLEQSTITTQIVRSSSTWSLGVNHTERSILNAYIYLIRNAKEYIFIENQFFMSKENEIASCIVQKIVAQVTSNNKSFKVIVMTPAIPGMAGHPHQSNLLYIQILFTLNTINEMYKELAQRLHISEVDVQQYLYFFSLRTHGRIGNKPVTEIIYIHSKLMIIDDKHVIIGSANLNNRSLLGDRDSQLAVVIEDNTPDNRFASTLLIKLIEEHFSITLQEEGQKFTDQIWNEMIRRSQINQKIYKKIFGCYPDNQIKRFSQLPEQPHNLVLYEQEIQNIKGNAVPYQRAFLKDHKPGKLDIKFWVTWYLSGPLT